MFSKSSLGYEGPSDLGPLPTHGVGVVEKVRRRGSRVGRMREVRRRVGGRIVDGDLSKRGKCLELELVAVYSIGARCTTMWRT